MGDAGLTRNFLPPDETTDLEVIKSKIETIRRMVEAESNLTSRTDDEFLLRFLYARKFDCDRAFKLIQNYYRLRQDSDDIFADFKPSTVEDLMLKTAMIILPKNNDSPAILVTKFGGWDPDAHGGINLVFRAILFYLEYMIEHEITKKNGVTIICDVEGFGYKQGSHVTPSFGFRMASIFQDVFPVKIKSIHFINTSRLIRFVFTIISPFLKQKIRDRIFFLGDDLEPLSKLFSDGQLPEYVGNGASLPNSEFINSLIARDEYFEDLAKYGYN